MKNLAEEWSEFRRDVIPDLPDDEAEEHRKSFYCGIATGLFRCLGNSAEFFDLKRELEVFFLELEVLASREKFNAPSQL